MHALFIFLFTADTRKTNKQYYYNQPNTHVHKQNHRQIHTNTQSQTFTHTHTHPHTHTGGEFEKQGQTGQEKENRAAALPTLSMHGNTTLPPSNSGAPS